MAVKPDTDILGLKIVSLESASIVGQVDGLIVDDDQTQVAGFIVDIGLYGASGLRWSDIKAVGSDAVIVEQDAGVFPIAEDPELERLALQAADLAHARAMTVSGKLVGQAHGFYVDVGDGRILGIQFVAEDMSVFPREPAALPISSVLRVSPGIVVVEDDYQRHLTKELAALERRAPAQTARHSKAAPLKATALAPVRPEGPGEPSAETPVGAGNGAAEQPDAAETIAASSPGEEVSTVSLDRPPEAAPIPKSDETRHFLIGHRVLRRIESPSGELIAAEGDVVTAGIVRRARMHDQLLILSLNVD